MPITSVLKLEYERDAECHVTKFKDTLWLEKPRSFERIRIYLDVQNGQISGLRLIMQGTSVKFIGDASSVIDLPQEKDFMRRDITEEYIAKQVKGTCGTYNETDTEVVLRFLKPLEKGKYALVFDLESSGYEESSFSMFILVGSRWKYVSRNFYGGIKKDDMGLIVECQRIELWMVPPYGGILWQFRPDKNYSRFTEMTEEAVSILQNDYGIPEPGPAGRIAYQWEEKRGFGKGDPSMMSEITCYFAAG